MMWNERDPSIRAVQSALSASSSAPWCLQGAAVGLWARERLRRYRAGRVRIDFYPDKRTIRVIDSLWTGAVGGDASSILNRIMAEWAARRLQVWGPAPGLFSAGPLSLSFPVGIVR